LWPSKHSKGKKETKDLKSETEKKRDRETEKQRDKEIERQRNRET
jgi:hypothetical protein